MVDIQRGVSAATMMQAEIKFIMANDHENWETWQPGDSSDVLEWFSLDIGVAGEPWSEIFQVAVATHKGLKSRRDKERKFRGFVVAEWSTEIVEEILNDYVSAIHGIAWMNIVDRLKVKLDYEYG